MRPKVYLVIFMSVPVSKRYTSNILYVYIPTRIIRNVQIIYRKFNQHYKRVEGKHLLNLSYELDINVHSANAIYVTQMIEEDTRLKYLIKAHVCCSSLCSMLDDYLVKPIYYYTNEKHDDIEVQVKNTL